MTTSLPGTLDSLPLEDCPLGQLLRTRERARLRIIVEHEESSIANQQRDHRSGLRQFREG